MSNSGHRRRDAYVPLPQLGEGLMAAGMHPDEANALVLEALRSAREVVAKEGETARSAE